MLKRIKTGKGPFSKGGGLLGESNEEFRIAGKAIDFAEFRDFMLLTSARDMRDMFEVWGRAVVDLGDVDVSMPMVRSPPPLPRCGPPPASAPSRSNFRWPDKAAL